MTTNETAFSQAKSVIPGGVDSPVRAFGGVGGTPRFIASASGARVTDVEGRSYVDLVGSWGPALLDAAEGADMLMVKPAGPYLDVLADVAAASDIPVAAYQVSGEYAMVEAAAANGWIDRTRVIDESLTGIFRAGADSVLTYWALEVARRAR